MKGQFGDVPIQKKKRSYKANGVRKTFILGLVHAMPETHANIERLMQEFSIDFFSWLIGDNKILRQGYGMQTCSSKFGCVWCHASSPYNYEENFTLRTFKSLRENYELFQQLVLEHGFEKAKALYAPQCKSVIRKNLVAGLDHERVIDRSPVGQLHVRLGAGNKTFDEMYKAMIEDIDNKE